MVLEWQMCRFPYLLAFFNLPYRTIVPCVICLCGGVNGPSHGLVTMFVFVWRKGRDFSDLRLSLRVLFVP